MALIWNVIGSTCYSAASFLYLMIVTRLCGVVEAGFFSLSYATAQLLLSVGRYGMRTYQATDLNREFSFTEYAVSRIFTCFVMLFAGVIYSAVSFDGSYIIVSVFVIMMKMVDAVEDVYHGNLQQNYNVELMGKLLAARNIFTTIVFTVSLAVTRDLKITCPVSAVSSLIFCLLINHWFSRKYIRQENEKTFRLNQLVRLMRFCTPVFIGTFLSLLLYNIPKYAMASIMTDDYQTYYSILFMPSFVITLMCEFVFKPTITSLADVWWNEKVKTFIKKVAVILMIIFAAGLVILAGGHLLGRTLLEIIYNVDLSPYKLHFIILLTGGILSAEVYMIYNILIAIRHGGCMIAVYTIATVLTALPARWMVGKWGVMGAVCNYLFSGFLLFVMFGGILIFIIGKRKGQESIL